MKITIESYEKDEIENLRKKMMQRKNFILNFFGKKKNFVVDGFYSASDINGGVNITAFLSEIKQL